MKLDQRSSPDLYVEELLARFYEQEGEAARVDLSAFAEHAAGGQIEDAIIELLELGPDESFAALMRWRDAMLGARLPIPIVRARLERMRRLATLSEREFCDASLLAAVIERHGATLAQMLARELRVDAPS